MSAAAALTDCDVTVEDFLSDDCAYSGVEFLSEAFTPEEVVEIENYLASRNPANMSLYWAGQLQRDAVKNWNVFYKNNKTKFFKDRHYLEFELPELASAVQAYRAALSEAASSPSGSSTSAAASVPQPPVLCEVGCGVGNAFFPLARAYPELLIQGCDCSRAAIDMIRAAPNYNPATMTVDVADLAKGPALPFPRGSADFATLIFVLSALAPEDIPTALLSARRGMKPGGLLLVRDYALYDMTMLRFGKGARISERFYRRGDGTRTYFFTRPELEGMLRDAGFRVQEGEVVYVRRTIVNRGEGKAMKRTWIRAKVIADPDWRDPLLDSPSTGASPTEETEAKNAV